jgi:hypothetical protein
VAPTARAQRLDVELALDDSGGPRNGVLTRGTLVGVRTGTGIDV